MINIIQRKDFQFITKYGYNLIERILRYFQDFSVNTWIQAKFNYNKLVYKKNLTSSLNLTFNEFSVEDPDDLHNLIFKIGLILEVLNYNELFGDNNEYTEKIIQNPAYNRIYEKISAFMEQIRGRLLTERDYGNLIRIIEEFIEDLALH